MEQRIGKITHFYNRISVAVLELTDELKIGDEIHILGRVTDFTQQVASLEVEHKKIPLAGPGMEIALKVDDYVRAGDEVFKVVG